MARRRRTLRNPTAKHEADTALPTAPPAARRLPARTPGQVERGRYRMAVARLAGTPYEGGFTEDMTGDPGSAGKANVYQSCGILSPTQDIMDPKTSVADATARAARRIEDRKKFRAAPGGTGIEKLAAMNAPAAAAAPAQMIRSDSAMIAGLAKKGDAASLGQIETFVENNPQYQNDPTVKFLTGSGAFDNKPLTPHQIKLKNMKEIAEIADDIKFSIDAGNSRSAQIKLDSLDLDKFNDRVRGQIEQIIAAPALTPKQKLEEIQRYAKLGASDKLTPGEEIEKDKKEADAAVAEKGRVEREKADKDEAKEKWTRRSSAFKIELAMAEKAVGDAEHALLKEKDKGDGINAPKQFWDDFTKAKADREDIRKRYLAHLYGDDAESPDTTADPGAGGVADGAATTQVAPGGATKADTDAQPGGEAAPAAADGAATTQVAPGGATKADTDAQPAKAPVGSGAAPAEAGTGIVDGTFGSPIPRPATKAELEVGKYYLSADGLVGKWTGKGFEVIQ